MKARKSGIYSQCLLGLVAALMLPGQPAAAKEKHLIYVASPGIRNYVQYGGVGVLVFDADNGYKFVKRIPTWDVPAGKEPENVKGIAASAKTGKLYVSTPNRMAGLDILTEKIIWDKTFEGAVTGWQSLPTASSFTRRRSKGRIGT